ncbi:hypothetical protein H5410_015648 [Solanum commersonii]|uniref:Uncharacterized protein n=1 Tax=Solanum commersonii TaxID=4109 RepID=A0A9J5ZUF4_SOLCO|nr:hypothetical protein H5410_015648 [Solanum commersonii]
MSGSATICADCYGECFSTCDATPQRDVFGYGVILFRMVSNEVDTQVCGRLIGERIVPPIEKEESLKEITKKLR